MPVTFRQFVEGSDVSDPRFRAASGIVAIVAALGISDSTHILSVNGFLLLLSCSAWVIAEVVGAYGEQTHEWDKQVAERIRDLFDPNFEYFIASHNFGDAFALAKLDPLISLEKGADAP